MLFLNVKLKYKLNLKLKHLLLKLLLKLVLRRRKRSDCGVSSETLGVCVRRHRVIHGRKIDTRTADVNAYSLLSHKYGRVTEVGAQE